jgi:RimJ/RimL family protein N-acetyltransferase
MHLRPLEERDLEFVRELRNRNREWFFDDQEITADAQRRWFDSLKDRPIRFYVIEEEAIAVGTVSLKDTPEGLEVGNFLLDDRYRGRDLMRQAVEQLTATPGRYVSHVKAGNERSLRVLQKTGFTLASKTLTKIVRA